METSVDQKLEAILFYKAQPVSKRELVKLLELDEATLQQASETLTQRLVGGATRLLVSDTELSLVTASEHDALIEQLRRDELKRDIGKAGAETLAIVLYRGPVTRGEIDRIRGVNSTYILRNLMTRGLVEKGSNPKRVEYQITADLLSHLGITHKQQLPQYEEILNQLDTFEQTVDTTNDT
jgi:segregation and condensation protein B